MTFKPSARNINFALAILLALGLSSCVVYDRPYGPGYAHSSPPPAGIAYYDYWYYPDVQVYFDIDRRVYFYLSNSRWVEVRVLPPSLRARLGGYIPLHSRYRQPYVEYREHSIKYPPRYREERRPVERHDNRYAPPARNTPYQQDYRGVPRKEPPARTWEQHIERQPAVKTPRSQPDHRSYEQPRSGGAKAPVRERYRESPVKE